VPAALHGDKIFLATFSTLTHHRPHQTRRIQTKAPEFGMNLEFCYSAT